MKVDIFLEMLALESTRFRGSKLTASDETSKKAAALLSCSSFSSAFSWTGAVWFSRDNFFSSLDGTGSRGSPLLLILNVASTTGLSVVALRDLKQLASGQGSGDN